MILWSIVLELYSTLETDSKLPNMLKVNKLAVATIQNMKFQLEYLEPPNIAIARQSQIFLLSKHKLSKGWLATGAHIEGKEKECF
jgi:hypothetical protein